MIVIWIFYLIILIGSVLFYVMFKDDFSFYVLTLVLTIPPILLVSLILLRRKVSVSLSCSKQVIHFGSECPVFLIIRNTSLMPVSCLKITLGYRNCLDGKEHEIVITAPAHLSNTDNIRLMLSSSYCGKIDVYIKKVRIYDFIKLFSMKLKVKAQPASFLIYPKLEAVEPAVSYYSNPYSESDSFSKHKPGDDSSEIFGLHDYTPGDRINRIHWKASAKEDKLIVKDYSLPLGNNIAFFICVSKKDAKDKTAALESYSLAMSALASVSISLCDNEVSHTVFINAANGYEAINITKEDELSSLLAQCLSSELTGENPFRAYEEYLSDCESAAASFFSHCVILCDAASPGLSEALAMGCNQQRQTVISVTDIPDVGTVLPSNTDLYSVRDNMVSVLSEITM